MGYGVGGLCGSMGREVKVGVWGWSMEWEVGVGV